MCECRLQTTLFTVVSLHTWGSKACMFQLVQAGRWREPGAEEAADNQWGYMFFLYFASDSEDKLYTCTPYISASSVYGWREMQTACMINNTIISTVFKWYIVSPYECRLRLKMSVVLVLEPSSSSSQVQVLTTGAQNHLCSTKNRYGKYFEYRNRSKQLTSKASLYAYAGVGDSCMRRRCLKNMF